ncbi:hypothetical protein MLD38_006586 [Melastoma candidum]|uniref:Uncharacterized protein n=1 Tax=Melastoma candidum TaxID=119954 RepID=A0ACB9RNW8_9MYRT|nr:hypothetical protein MLD38_006586 [Melastoma candidum]
MWRGFAIRDRGAPSGSLLERAMSSGAANLGVGGAVRSESGVEVVESVERRSGAKPMVAAANAGHGSSRSEENRGVTAASGQVMVLLLAGKPLGEADDCVDFWVLFTGINGDDRLSVAARFGSLDVRGRSGGCSRRGGEAKAEEVFEDVIGTVLLVLGTPGEDRFVAASAGFGDIHVGVSKMRWSAKMRMGTAWIWSRAWEKTSTAVDIGVGSAAQLEQKDATHHRSQLVKPGSSSEVNVATAASGKVEDHHNQGIDRGTGVAIEVQMGSHGAICVSWQQGHLIGQWENIDAVSLSLVSQVGWRGVLVFLSR